MKKVPVWDAAVRVFHWGVALLVLAAFLTADDDDWLGRHAEIGLVLLGAVLFRLAWGLWGSPPARFRAFVPSPRAVLAYARDYVRGRPPLHVSHNPLGAVMVLVLLGTLVATTVTGLLAYSGPTWGGALAGVMARDTAHGLKEVHEALAELLPWLIGAHVAGVLVSSLLERQNLVAAMITGRKRAPAPVASAGSPTRTAAGVLGAALLAYVLVRAASTLLPLAVPEASAAPGGETPRGILADYETAARQADGGFVSDPARGRALFTRRVERDGATRSCSSCHTNDPRGHGKTPAGKVIAPLAPSANPDAFTSRKKADKWFDRNCGQVLGRPCTPAEKSDLLRSFLEP